MLSSPRNSVTHNQQAKLAVDYNELLKELSSHEMTSVGCYTIGETIGEGTFGKVKKGTHKLTGKVVAIKKISKQHAPMMAREIHHHRQLKHPNIVMLYEMITTESAIHIISEYCPNGDLLDALTEDGRCPNNRVHKWFRQLIDAIKYCHTRGIVHRDLKLENILLDADDNVKICDFGFARFAQKNQYLETYCGSLSYSAPEIILRNKYTGPETDIWSLGVILYTLLAGEFPFDDDNEIITQKKIVKVEYTIPFYFSSNTTSLIQNMLQLKPSDRITVDAMMEHPWILETDDEEDACLTPSSSTTTNQSETDSIFSQPTENTIALDDGIDFHVSPDLKFSPQVRSSLGIQTKSPRFSAPTLNNRRSTQATFQSSFRTSLPSSFYNTRKESATENMTPIEQRLFAALTAAGFDRDALIKMQTGECDTSSTLWHLLLENMSSPTKQTIPDALASAIQSRSQKQTPIDRGIQTSLDEPYIKPYPAPIVHQQSIQTVGFGSPMIHQEKSGWFTSVKSWFGSSSKQPPPIQRSRSSSNCSTISSPVSTPSSYRNFDTTRTDPDQIMSQPVYRTKYRRRALQLTDPPVSELDQLTYNSTTTQRQATKHAFEYQLTMVPSQVHMPPTALTTKCATDTFLEQVDVCQKRYYRQQQPTPPPSPPQLSDCSDEEEMATTMPLPTPPIETVPKKLETPVNSPIKIVHPPIKKIEITPQPVKKVETVSPPVKKIETAPPPVKKVEPAPPIIKTVESLRLAAPVRSELSIKPQPSSPNTLKTLHLSSTPPSETSPLDRPRTSRFEFQPRSRLSIYGMQEPRGMGSKPIIEEEEEEEEEE